jgi:beta-glucanase (GH16 family)
LAKVSRILRLRVPIHPCSSIEAEGLGIPLAEAQRHLPQASTLGAAAAVGFFCRASFEEGLGAFGLAVEMQVPGRRVGADVIYNALREHYQGADGLAREYTSARLKTQGRFEQMYGRFEARLQLPRGQGLWPAFWMMGANLNAVGWPQAGELDIMENIGKEPAIVHGTIHGPGYSGADSISGAYTLPGGAAVADAFHVFAMEWEPAVIRFYVDDTLFATRTPADLKPGQAWVFDHPFFLLLNVAVGGSWPGNPDATTVFPQTMRVDYVRVYSQAR